MPGFLRPLDQIFREIEFFSVGGNSDLLELVKATIRQTIHRRFYSGPEGDIESTVTLLTSSLQHPGLFATSDRFSYRIFVQGMKYLPFEGSRPANQLIFEHLFPNQVGVRCVIQSDTFLCLLEILCKFDQIMDRRRRVRPDLPLLRLPE